MPRHDGLNAVSLTQAKADLSALLKRARVTKRPFSLTSRGKPTAVLMGFNAFLRLSRRFDKVQAALGRLHGAL